MRRQQPAATGGGGGDTDGGEPDPPRDRSDVAFGQGTWCGGSSIDLVDSLTIMVSCLILFLTLFLPLSSAQADFISIKSCAPSNTTDKRTITWTPDNYFFQNVGRCKIISAPYISNKWYRRARIFGADHNSRWCTNLPVIHGQDYLVRATFLYGPMIRSMPETYFNISIGSTSIARVNSSLNSLEVEGVFLATNNHTHVCLLRGKGNAYISMFEMRPLNDVSYLDGNTSAILKLVTRVDLGNNYKFYRYPEDPADRQWEIQTNLNESSILSSSDIFPRTGSSVPLQVLQTATMDVEQLRFLYTNVDTSHDEYLIILYFLELNANLQAGQRVFDIYVNGDKKYEKFDILENGNGSNYREFSLRVIKSSYYLNISLVKVSSEVEYGPICNAYEIFEVHPRTAETAETYVNAMEELRNELMGENPENEFLRKWNGDPCVPSPWEGLACEERNGTLVITMLDISSKNLQGPFPRIISDLAELRELDVQNNNFTGPIPESFASLLHLSKMSVKCNPQLNSKLPPGLLGRTNLTIVSGCSQDPLQSKAPQQTVYFIGSVAGGSVALTVALGMIFTCFYKRSRHPPRRDHLVTKNSIFSGTSFHDLRMNPVVKSFSLQYIEKATCNYKTLIGEGGFGAVYRGTLPQGQEVAVKVRSATSTQGTREFNNEVDLLSNLRHENLVPLLGHCCENDQQILVYPFMSNGSLQDRLYGEASKRKSLDWPTRLSIALGAARGLMYLHTFAGRCIIHRDVKSSNILLDHSMCGKVADFGFSKYAPQEGDSGASLEVRGTAGYLDPEYYSTQQLSTKSDVFSFGVVLLEIVTGREPLNIHRPRNEWSLLEWAKPFIRESRIDEIVDPSIKGGYHAEAMWRVVEAALACIEPFSTYRPSMVDIVRELEDALIIENNASEYMRSIESIGGSNRFLSVERKMIATTPTPTEPSPCQIMAVVQPR